ncbi:MAG: 3-dehydroquinate synthase II [Peptococcaceae bacterium]|nr:3-dehydroquinate synthase II [Peptococcaceae bacterium]
MGKRQREIWFDGRTVPLERQDIWSLVNNSPIEKVVVSAEQIRDGHYPHKTHLIMEVRNEEELSGLSAGEIVFSDNRNLLEAARQQGYRTCIFLSINSEEALQQSWRDAAMFDYAAVDFDLPTNIPLELIIARLQGSNTVLLRRVETLVDMEVAFGVLEKGSDGVLFSGTETAEIQQLSNYLLRGKIGRLELTPLVVTEVRHIGMGSRACIDTTDLMTTEEGMLVGSTSGGGIFVCSETHFLPYMKTRPFRVNAGAVHSYVWAPNNTTEYITDLAAGSKVLCVNTKGEARELTVGRVKIEVRPLLLIKGEAAGTELNVIVQDDWHIRIMGADGQPQNASAIRPGKKLLAYVCEPGRHVGIKINETIIEK